MKKLTPLTKAIIFLAILGSGKTISFAQQKDQLISKAHVQLNAGRITSKGKSIGYSGQFILNKWVFTIGKQTLKYNSDIPSDYRSGSTYVLFIPANESIPDSKIKSIYVSGGRVFYAGKKVWITAEAGITFFKTEETRFEKTNQVNYDPMLLFLGIWGQSSNYNIYKEKRNGTGTLIKCDFNWQLERYAGIGAGIFTQINNVKSSFGVELKLIIGLLNRK